MTESCSPGTGCRPGVALALQGGGAYGAFTRGVLDRLLEDGLQLGTVCAVSSGAILGALLVQGLVGGGNAGARRKMRCLWRRVAKDPTQDPASHPSDPTPHPASHPAPHSTPNRPGRPTRGATADSAV